MTLGEPHEQHHQPRRYRHRDSGHRPGLVGCSSAGGASLIQGPPKAAAETTTPTPTAIPGDTDGNGRLSEFEKQILAKNAAKDYTMPDGSVVKIDPKEPLPEAVKAIVTKEAAPVTAQYSSYADDVAAPAVKNIRAFVEAKAEETGKPIVVMFSAPQASVNGGGNGNAWGSLASGMKSTGIMASPSKDAMTVTMREWASSRGYELIVVD